MADPCLESVRAGDKDRFLATLLAPETIQPSLFALQAFAVELARIPCLVSEAPIGEIRLQWWSDTLTNIADMNSHDHPLAQALMQAINKHALPLEPLRAMIDARRSDLYADRFADVTALETYLGETESALLQLSCLVASHSEAVSATNASGYGGVAFGLARLLTTPGDRFLPVGMSRADLHAHALKRLSEANAAIAKLPPSLFPVFLPVALTELYLKAGAVPSQWRRQWRLWRTARRGRMPT